MEADVNLDYGWLSRRGGARGSERGQVPGGRVVHPVQAGVPVK